MEGWEGAEGRERGPRAFSQPAPNLLHHCLTLEGNLLTNTVIAFRFVASGFVRPEAES